jgi:hypothetical protein
MSLGGIGLPVLFGRHCNFMRTFYDGTFYLVIISCIYMSTPSPRRPVKKVSQHFSQPAENFRK